MALGGMSRCVYWGRAGGGCEDIKMCLRWDGEKVKNTHAHVHCACACSWEV